MRSLRVVVLLTALAALTLPLPSATVEADCGNCKECILISGKWRCFITWEHDKSCICIEQQGGAQPCQLFGNCISG